MSSIKFAIREIGISAVASGCQVTTRAVYKWLANGALPKTEFFGGTNYASKIEELSDGKYKAEDLLAETKSKLLSQH